VIGFLCNKASIIIVLLMLTKLNYIQEIEV
jgi:hypothetical protein